MACFGVLLLPAPSLSLLSPVNPKLDLYKVLAGILAVKQE